MELDEIDDHDQDIRPPRHIRGKKAKYPHQSHAKYQPHRSDSTEDTAQYPPPAQIRHVCQFQDHK